MALEDSIREATKRQRAVIEALEKEARKVERAGEGEERVTITPRKTEE